MRKISIYTPRLFIFLLACLFVSSIILAPTYAETGFAWLVHIRNTQTGWAFPVIFVFTYLVATTLCIPGSFFSLSAGTLFGQWFGFAIVLIASNLATTLSFWIARSLGPDLSQRIAGKSVIRIQQSLDHHGVNWVVLIRLIPGIPFCLVNYGFGLTRIRWKHYWVGTLIGMFPWSFIYVSMGNSFTMIDLTQPAFLMNPKFWGPFALAILLTVAVDQYRRRSASGAKIDKIK